MESIKALLHLQVFIGALVFSTAIGNFCLSSKAAMQTSTGYNLPFVNVRKEEETLAMSLVKKYKIIWKNGRRKIAIKYKKHNG